jgi:TfoX/Sxy family transcriptional regulator of competence genes
VYPPEEATGFAFKSGGEIVLPYVKQGDVMATNKEFADFIVEQIENAGTITYKKMFGEYALYSDGKVVALICDNQLFVKPTESGRALIGDVKEAPPYPGAKMYFLIEEKVDDREWLSELIRITTKELPEPELKKKKVKRK